MIKSIHIKNFRSHIDFEMEFNQGLNVIIGENDAGKTTLIDSLKILFGNKKIGYGFKTTITNWISL